MRRSKPAISPLDRERPLREAPFAADNLRQHHRDRYFRNAAGSNVLGRAALAWDVPHQAKCWWRRFQTRDNWAILNRRGGGGRRDRQTFCHGGFHHAYSSVIVLSVVGVGSSAGRCSRSPSTRSRSSRRDRGIRRLPRGSGVIGALVVGVLAGGATLAIGQIAFATAEHRSSAP